MYPIIASVVGWMTDQRPEWFVMPAAELHSEEYGWVSTLAQDLETVLQANHHVYSWGKELEAACWDTHVYGISFLKACWDDTLEDGMGNATLHRVDPFTLYPDPQATCLDDCNYVIEARKMSLQEVDRRWPGSLRKLRSGDLGDELDFSPTQLSDSGRTPKANPGAISPSTSSSYGLPGQGRISVQDHEGVVVLECWLREHEHEGDRTHDGWRCVVVAGSHVLMDEAASDLWEHGRHPYVRFVPHETGEFYGVSMVEMLSPAQLAINRLLAALQHNIELTGNPPFLEDTRSGLQRTKVVNKPGQRLSISASARAEWLKPPPLNQMMFQLIPFYIAEMERISGLSAMTRGNIPSGRNSEGTLDTLQEASFVRIRMALRNLERAMREAGALLASLITENYTTPRFVQVIGPSGERAALALKSRHFYSPTKRGGSPYKFNLLVNAGSDLPTSRLARAQEADVLFAMGAIDEQAVLEAHNWPNRGEVWRRVMELKAQGWTPPGARQRTQRTQ
jgi:hypothetical protein